MTKLSIGLALGSGAGRGWAHIGVLRALERAGVRPDVVCGTSIGALVGGVWLADHLDTLAHWALGLNSMRILRYLDISLTGGGVIAGRRLQRLLTDNVGAIRIEDLKTPFACVATELATGHEIWLRSGSLVDAIRASYALPGIFNPVSVEGRVLVDGALVNPVPVSVCRARGCRLVIAVNLNADIVGKRRRRAADDGAAGDADQRLKAAARGAGGRLLDQLLSRDDGPSLFNVMVSSLNILQDRIGRSRLAGDPPDVTIAPRLGHIGLLEFDRAEEAIAEGEVAVERALPFLREAIDVLT